MSCFPGATWIAPSKTPFEPLAIVSPSPRERAYLSFFSEDGRVFEELSLRGCVATVDGSDVIRASGIGTADRARELGLSVAEELIELGARDLLAIERSET